MDQRTVGVTIRELYRHAAALLDEIERTGRGIVISRYGRAVAYMGPLPDDYQPGSFERVHVIPRSQQMAALLPEDEVDDQVAPEIVAALTERQRAFMSVLDACDAKWWMPHSNEEMELRKGWFQLECEGLLETREGGGWRITSKGRRAVEMLRAS